MSNEAILVKSDDWEGLFINGKLVEEGHTLNEGTSRIKYFSSLAKKYNFSLEDMKEAWVTEGYEEWLYDSGSFHENLSDINYELDE